MDAAHADARRGVRLEQISVLWIVVEAIVSLGAGIAAASLLLTAFGIDSLIELGSAVVLLAGRSRWRRRRRSEPWSPSPPR